MEQLVRSRKQMLNLQKEQTELVTNVQVALDYRKSCHRAEQQDVSKRRVEKLENEAKTSVEKFEEINQKWTLAKQKKVPQDVLDALKSQQKLCALLIEGKNKLMSELQQELKASDERYIKELKKQAGDIHLMTDRMENQIKTLQKSYREEVDHIEKAFERERKELFGENQMRWQQMMKERENKEMEFVTQRMNQVEEHQTALQNFQQENDEQYNILKSKLDLEVQALEQYLQQTRATYHLNQEKLEYNFHVLKKREEENVITKTQQKRKINRLQDVLNNTKLKCGEQEKQSREENKSLTQDYVRAAQQYKHMKKKMRRFLTSDTKNLLEICQMNEMEVKDLVKKALLIDQMLHEQQLGVCWEQPKLPFMDPLEPELVNHQVVKSATETAAELLKAEQDVAGDASTAPVSANTVKKLLEVLCDEAGFLVEGKLLKLLSSLKKNEQSLLKLDSIFKALQIEHEDDVLKLAKFFITYRTNKQPKEMSQGGSSSNPELIHPNEVMEALQAFTVQHCRKKETIMISSTMREEALDTAYWEAMANIIPESKLQIWGALEAALEKYHSVLKERSRLLMHTEILQKQNQELRALLQQYGRAKVGPTRILQH